MILNRGVAKNNDKVGVRVYLDYAAATPLDKEVLSAMEPFWSNGFGNGHSVHQEGRVARSAIEDARARISKYIGAYPGEFLFTSSGTESNCLAIFGLVDWVQEHASRERVHIITSAIEHPSVIDCFRKLERRGSIVSYIGVDRDGILDMEELVRSINKDTVLVSIMHTNNEIGTLQPIADIGKVISVLRKKEKTPFPFLHTDASQAPLYVKLDVDLLGVDLLSVDAQKLHGPKGVGGLYIRSSCSMNPHCYGGNQERGLRPGTVNTPGVIGFARAYDLAEERREKDSARVGMLRDNFTQAVIEALPEVYVNGSLTERLPNNINFSFPGIEGEYIVMALDEEGISVSTRSACMTGGGEGSYVVAALDRSRAQNSVRFTLGRDTTQGELDRVVKTLCAIVGRLKKL